MTVQFPPAQDSAPFCAVSPQLIALAEFVGAEVKLEYDIFQERFPPCVTVWPSVVTEHVLQTISDGTVFVCSGPEGENTHML